MNHHFKNVFAVVLAGGSGTRFWPRSRQTYPKQLCKINHPQMTMIEETLERIESIIPFERRMIVTHESQKQATQKIVKHLCPQLIAEPLSRNTAAALALAALQIAYKFPKELEEAVMVSLHADHVIQNHLGFISTLERAVATARKGKLTLIGIPPSRPETGYGYIEKGESLYAADIKDAYSVQSFKEKPDLQTAQKYCADKRFLWNSGMFVWKVTTILQEFRQHLPEMLSILEPLAKQLSQAGEDFTDIHDNVLRPYYEKVPAIAIDNAILEKSQNIAVVTAEMDWFDVGGWPALEEVKPTDPQGNFTEGDVMLISSENCTVASDSYFVATLGLKDMIVVVDKGCVLVCPKDRGQDVKLIVDELKKRGRVELT